MKKLFAAMLLLANTGCFLSSSRMVKSDAVVASVNGRFITVARLDSTVKQLEKNTESGMRSDTLKQAALDSLIVHTLIDIRTDSIRQSLESDVAFRQKRLDDVNQTIFKVLFEKQIGSRIRVDSAEVLKQFGENQAQYYEPDKVKARHILVRRPKPDTAGVTSEEQRKELIDDSDKFARERALGVLEKALAGEEWDTLAATYSEDANNAKKGGDLGYFTRGRMVPEFDSAAFAAQPGNILGPVATKFGYHVIKIEDFQKARPMPMDENLFGQIRVELIGQKEKEFSNVFLDSLKANASYLYNDEELAKPESLIADDSWIMAANSSDTVFGFTYKESVPKYMRWKKINTMSMENKKELLSVLSPSYLLRSATRSLGYMNDPQITRAIGEATNSEATLRMSRYLRELEYDPSEEEIADYFNTNIESYKEKRPLLIHHILFQDSAFAEAIRDSIVAGADFAEMAKRYYPGEPDIREVLYNLDYIGREEMGRDFYGAAETLTVGSVSHPVKTGWGYHLIKLVNRKQDRTLAQVRPGIKQHLKAVRDAEKTAKIVARWRKDATININEKVLAGYKPAEKKVIRIEANVSEQKGK